MEVSHLNSNMFNKTKTLGKEATPRFKITWESKVNEEGVSPKKWIIEKAHPDSVLFMYSTAFSTISDVSTEEIKELRDLLIKLCLD